MSSFVATTRSTDHNLPHAHIDHGIQPTLGAQPTLCKADSNAMMVGFLNEFADAEEFVGNATGAAALRGKVKPDC